MNYKDLFKRVISLISSPAKAWEEIGKEEDRRKVLGAFVYPMIGLCGLSVFIGTFIGNTEGVAAFQIAMTRCCAIFVSLFGGYFLAAYAIDQLGKKLLGREDQYELNQQFVGYSMVVTFVLDIVSGLFSISILHWILQTYGPQDRQRRQMRHDRIRKLGHGARQGIDRKRTLDRLVRPQSGGDEGK